MASLNESINEIERRPTVITDEDFRIELDQLEEDIDELYDKVKTTTGADSIMQQVQDIKRRQKDIARTLESVNENIDGIKSKTTEAQAISDHTDTNLEQVALILFEKKKN